MPRTGENIYKRKDGRWEARYICAHDSQRKAVYKYIYAKTYKEVKAKMLKSITESKKNANDEKHICEYGILLDNWLKSKELSVKESTYIRYKNAVEKHIKPSLGKYSISSINTETVEDFIQKKLKNGRLDGKDGLSPKSAEDILIMIKNSFKYAEYQGITVNCKLAGVSVKKRYKEMRVLTADEEDRLLGVILKNIDRYKLGVFICLYTGIRIGELCALRWENISRDDETVKIEKTLQRLQINNTEADRKTKIIITDPKSERSQRTVPLPKFVSNIIEPARESESIYILSGKIHPSEPRTVQYRFKSYLKEAGITPAGFHSLRHTFATRCIEAGFDAKTLSEILGHSSVNITLDRYVHSSLELKRINMEKLCRRV